MSKETGPDLDRSCDAIGKVIKTAPDDMLGEGEHPAAMTTATSGETVQTSVQLLSKENIVFMTRRPSANVGTATVLFPIRPKSVCRMIST